MRFKYILFIIAILGLCCRKDVDEVVPSYILPQPTEFVKSTISGLVIDENSIAIVGANVKIGNQTTLTDGNGVFIFHDLVVDANGAYIKVEKEGYFHSSRTIITTQNSRNNVTIQLLAVSQSKSFNSNSKFTANFGDYMIEIPANALETQNGTSYNSYAKLTSRWLSPTDLDFGLKMPGRLVGLNSEGKITGLVSMGMISAELTDISGNKLKLKAGYEASIRMRVPFSILGKAPVNIPTWYFDEKNGIWIEEGSASLSNGFYEYKVKHFTFWNCDYPAPLVEMKFNVKDENGKALPMAFVNIKLINSSSSGSGYTDDDGILTALIPKDEQMEIAISLPYYECASPLLIEQIGPFSQDGTINLVVNTSVAVKYILTGELVNCDGEPVVNGYIKLTGDKSVIWVDKSGHFERTIIKCIGQPNDLFLYKAIDLDKIKSSKDLNITIPKGGKGNTGPITVCSDLTEYFIYKFNGETYNYADAVFSGSSSQNLYIFRNGSKGLNFTFYIEKLTGLGSYDVASFYASGNDKLNNKVVHGCNACDDLKVTIDEFNGPGGFIGGTFSGIVSDKTDTMNIVPIPVGGSFRGIWNN